MKTKFFRGNLSRFRRFMTFSVLAFLSFEGWSQGNVRIEIPNPVDVPTVSDLGNGTYRLNFSNPQLTQLLANYTVVGFGKEFPMFQEEGRLKNIYFISYSSPGDLFADISNLSVFPLTENIGIAEPLSVPTDYTGWPSFDVINVPGAWNITESTPGVKLGVFDERFTDPATNQAPHLDAAVEYGTTNAYMGYSYHSDGVASTISATPNDGLTHWTGLAAGIGYNSRLYVSSVYYPLTLAIQDQIARGMRAINVSMAMGACSGSAIEQLFYDKVAEKKVIVVCASGNGQIGYGVHIMNNGTEYCMPGMPATVCHPDYTGNSNGYIYPAAYNNVLSVASISITDNLYGDFSSYNPNNALDCDGDGTLETPIAGTVTLNDQVDVLAPPSGPSPNGHGTTSIAAPVITGAVGLMLSVNPNLDVNEIIDIFNQSGVNVTSTGSNPGGPANNNSDYYQNGSSNIYKLKDEVRRIDVEAAVIEAKNRYDAWLVTQAAQASQLQRVNTGDHVNDQVSSFALNWVDYDNDNDLDIFNGTNIADPQSPTPAFLLFENQCEPAEFNAIDLPGFESGNNVISKIGWGDFDNDGDKDFIGFNEANELIFYQNSGGSSFTQTTIAAMTSGILMRAGIVADFNADGNLDFIVGPRDAHTSPNYVYVFQGNGNGTFTPVSNGSDLFSDDLSFNAATSGDINGDGNQDIAMTGASGTDFENLYYGDGNFGFTKVTLDPAQVNLIGYGVNMVDYDNDTDLDLYFHCYPHGILFNNLNNGKFFYTDNLLLTNDPTVANSNATWGDYDNDGDQDVYVPSLQTKTLYNNERGIIFSQAVHEAASQASEFNHETGNSAFGDGDGDGDLDLYVSNFFNDDLNNYYYVNQGNTNNWIKLKLTGANNDFLGNGRKTSVSAEGTEVVAMMTSYTSFLGNVGLTQTRYLQTNDGSPHDLHFGFGDFASQVSIRIKWPSGLTETFLLDLNLCYKITEGTGTYTNDCACQEIDPPGNEVSGNIGLDANQDCNCDDDANQVLDEALNDIWVEFQQLDGGGNPITGQVYYTTTGPNGAYSIVLPDGDYLVQPYLNGTAYDVSNNCSPLPVNGPVENYNISVGPDADDLNFCLKANSCDIDLSIYPVYTYPASAPCPGVEQELCMYIENNGNTVQNPQFQLDLGPNVTITSATSACGTPTVTNGINVISLIPSGDFGSQDVCTICVTFTVDGALNDVVTATGSVNGSCQEQASWSEMISCAYDPNDKLLVTPQSCGPENNIPKDETLIYRVRFQNTGNAPATNVIIQDQLDEHLDLSGFHVLASSHTVTGVDVLPDNNLLIKFENIQLPSAGNNEEASHGYVIFGINPLANVTEGTVVENTASIFFDLNSAIVTNTTMNTLREFPYPDADFTFGRSCDVLAASYDFEYSGETPDGATYLWNFGPNASPSASTQQNPDHILFSASGTQQISLTVTRHGCTKTIVLPVDVSSPVGCNGSKKKVKLCKNGTEVCVSINAAASMIANAGFCVGDCKDAKHDKSIVTDLSEQTFDEISLFPNPGNGSFHVVHSGPEIPVSVTVTNSLGEIVLTKYVDQSSYTVDLTQEANGVYFFLIKTDQGSYHYKAVKQ
ncbi:MAG: DUF7619 domain-containing protein [Bacteroidota bacterium]